MANWPITHSFKEDGSEIQDRFLVHHWVLENNNMTEYCRIWQNCQSKLSGVYNCSLLRWEPQTWMEKLALPVEAHHYEWRWTFNPSMARNPSELHFGTSTWVQKDMAMNNGSRAAFRNRWSACPAPNLSMAAAASTKTNGLIDLVPDVDQK